jgi:hypothetical protein
LHHKLPADYSDRHQRLDGKEKIDGSSSSQRNFASAQHHAQSVQQPSSENPSKSKYDLPMSSYHPVISQDFNPLKTTMGHVEDDIPNESALYRQINQTGSDMQYRPTTSDRNSAQFKPHSEKDTAYAQMTAVEKAYHGLSAQASAKMLNNIRGGTDQSKSTISDEELSDYSSSMDLNANQGRYNQKEARPIANVREHKHTAHQVLQGANTTPQQKMQMHGEHVQVRQFNDVARAQAMISEDSDSSSLSSSSGSIVSGTVTGTDMESSLTQSIDSSTI